METPYVSIVIPVLNEERYIEACLQSVTSLVYPDDKLEIILVDNGSTDNTLKIAENFSVRILEKESVKVGAVRNYGVLKSKGDIIVFLDSDCVVDKNWLQEGVDFLEKGLDAVGGLYLLRENPAWIEKYWILKSSKDFVYQKTFVGGCIFIKKNVFNAVNGFDENLSAGEDTDLTRKLIDENFNIAIKGDLSVIHLGYPDTVSSFVKRQMWHSEGYFANLFKSLSDRIFILTNAFILGFLILVFNFFVENIYSNGLLAIGIFLFMFSPAVLTFKRINRYKYKDIFSIKLIQIYIVDIIYLFARSMGIFRSVKIHFLKKTQKKYARR